MTMADTAADFHRWAKDAGNKLRAYILSYASGATAVFFIALTGNDVASLTFGDKLLLCIALVLYVSTTILCLVELQVDARRFFYLAKQYERPEDQRDWSLNVLHVEAKKQGRANFYAEYNIKVCEVLRESRFKAGGS